MKVLFAVSLVACAMPAVAVAQNAVATGATKAPDPTKRTRRQDTAIGSVMAKSTCHTRVGWDAIERANAN